MDYNNFPTKRLNGKDGKPLQLGTKTHPYTFSNQPLQTACKSYPPLEAQNSIRTSSTSEDKAEEKEKKGNRKNNKK